MDNKIKVREVATNAFEIFKKGENSATYGAFGCCVLIIKDKVSGNYLLAHVGQETVLVPPLVDRSVKQMLNVCKQNGFI